MSQADSLKSSRLNHGKLLALGIDLGGTKLSAALVADGQVSGEARVVATPHGPEKIIDAIVELVQGFQSEFALCGVGIATAGVVNCDTGEVVASTGNLPGWAGTPIKNLVETRTKLPVFVDNDANAAAYGDAVSMGFTGAACVIGVTLGTGIGTGIVIDGKVYRGACWGAGECGHIRLSLGNKRLCTCGLFDCWEAYGSGRGLVVTCRELLEGVTFKQTDLAKDTDMLTTRMITAAADEGDTFALKAIELWHEHVASGLASLVNAFDPDCFILSGGMSKVVDLDMLMKQLRQRCLPGRGDRQRVLKSSLGDFAGIVGAAQSVMDGITAGAALQAKV
jgi:glucokinase